MSEQYADLHLHTRHSDGDASVEELLAEVAKTDLAAIAITDHDSFEGIDIAHALNTRSDLKIISGVELSTAYKGKDVHMLGYFFDHHYPEFVEYCQRFRDEREQRAVKMVQKLNDLGAKIAVDRVYEIADGGAIGRPHVAQTMVEAGFVKNLQSAFDKYISNDGPAYVPKYKIDPVAAIDLIHRAGGVAVMAHPGIVRDDSIVAHLAKNGLDGLEVHHPNHMLMRCEEFYAGLADKYGLLHTGGSDWHGARKPDIWIGKAKVSMERVQKLEEAASRYQQV